MSMLHDEDDDYIMERKAKGGVVLGLFAAVSAVVLVLLITFAANKKPDTKKTADNKQSTVKKASEENVWTVFNAYKEQFDTSIWDIDAYDIYYQDEMLVVYYDDDYYNGTFLIEIQERKVTSAPPTASQIASAIGYDKPSDIYVVTGGGSALYNGPSNRYNIYNYSETTFADGIAGLQANGYELSSQTAVFASLFKVVNESGDCIRVTLNVSGSGSNPPIFVEYSLETN